MNDVQKVVFDMFRSFAEVCEKLGLRYFLANGSALGAVKYGGFIPWDDDLDVVMPRKDYEIFLKKGKDLLAQNLFIQNYRTDREFPFIYSKIRNTDTTFVEESVSHLDMNHGIYMDIFPLDGFRDGGLRGKIKEIRVKILFWFAFSSLKDGNAPPKIRLRNKILRFIGAHKRTDKALKKLEKLVSDTDETTEFCCNYGDRQRKGFVKREWYGKGHRITFEGADAIIPEKYDEYFTYKYGDWRCDLPVDSQKSHHKAVICDVNQSYINML